MISKASKVLNSEASFGGGDFDTINSKAKSQLTSNNGNSKIKPVFILSFAYCSFYVFRREVAPL